MADTHKDRDATHAATPLDLRVRGHWPLTPAPIVAIIGARRRTPYGEVVSERLAGDLARYGVTVLSALAFGIEYAAHQGAIEAGGRTVAVLGTGIDIVYPPALAPLAERIVDAGGTLVSSFPDGTTPGSGNVPRRNVTMATLADVIVVVEATANSASLTTAHAAIILGKPVMAVPGSFFSPLSVGCHQLLRDGARLVRNAHDVMAELPGRVATS
jgi:DNA processing protein